MLLKIAINNIEAHMFFGKKLTPKGGLTPLPTRKRYFFLFGSFSKKEMSLSDGEGGLGPYLDLDPLERVVTPVNRTSAGFSK